MANTSDEAQLEALVNTLPVDLRRRFQRFVLENKCLLRALDAKYFAKCAETEGAELLAAIGEYAMARFDLLAYHVVQLFSYPVNPNALRANPAVEQRLTELISQTLSFTAAAFDKLGPARATELGSELHLKLLAKEQACLSVVERRLASGDESNFDFLNFSRIVAQSPMKSREAWWAKPQLDDCAGRRAMDLAAAINECLDPYAYQMDSTDFADASNESAESSERERSVLEDDRTQRPRFFKRAEWLRQRLLERGWSSSDPYAHGGPDRKTIEKILRGQAVRNDVLKKLSDSLSRSKEGTVVKVLDIPKE